MHSLSFRVEDVPWIGGPGPAGRALRLDRSLAAIARGEEPPPWSPATPTCTAPQAAGGRCGKGEAGGVGKHAISR
jgi:hypothetical protein